MGRVAPPTPERHGDRRGGTVGNEFTRGEPWFDIMASQGRPVAWFDSLNEGFGGQVDRTTISMRRKDIPAFRITGSTPSPGRAGVSTEDPDRKLHGVTDVTIDGGNRGIDLTCFCNASMRFVNVRIAGSATLPRSPPRSVRSLLQ